MNKTTLTAAEIVEIESNTQRNDHTTAVIQLLDILFFNEVISSDVFQAHSNMLGLIQDSQIQRGHMLSTEIDLRTSIRNHLLLICENEDEVRRAF
jgi:hypothetical protein